MRSGGTRIVSPSELPPVGTPVELKDHPLPTGTVVGYAGVLGPIVRGELAVVCMGVRVEWDGHEGSYRSVEHVDDLWVSRRAVAA